MRLALGCGHRAEGVSASKNMVWFYILNNRIVAYRPKPAHDAAIGELMTNGYPDLVTEIRPGRPPRIVLNCDSRDAEELWPHPS